MLDRLPPRSHLPFLARQWDDTVAELSTFLARWNVEPARQGRWAWALGPRRSQPGLEHERRQLAARLVDLTAATAQEVAREAGWDLPDWTRVHLAHHASLGTCMHDPDELRSLYQRVESYRRKAGVQDDEVPNTAEEAIFGQGPENAVLRMTRRVLVDETLPRDAVPVRHRVEPARERNRK